jgi:hypothetical protein
LGIAFFPLESACSIAKRSGSSNQTSKLARWSRKYADELTKMAEDFRRREEEEELNRR